MAGPLTVWGVSPEELRGVLKECFPERECRVEDPGRFVRRGTCDSKEPDGEDKDLLIAYLREESSHLEIKVAASNASIHAFHSQQKQLFDEFCLLRQRYDDQKQNIIDVLWTKCATHHPDLHNIPFLNEDLVANESDERIGPYSIGKVLGEGQFATVKECWLESEGHESGTQWALKIIKKERLISFGSLKRVSNEIEILRVLKSPHVVALHDAIQAPSKLYIVTERGGSDLFEFFDEHPEGVPEPWAREITAKLLRGINYCHRQGICHRDLKPENVLLRFDTESERCIDVKLCDFGLSVKTRPGLVLTDFCGSPGFFAPEMIVHNGYFGDKADVWSTGCILLELILGHERFCDAWMSAYDFDVLQDKVRFEDMINSAVAALPDALEFPRDLKDFVLQFVKIRSSERPTIAELCRHTWLSEVFSGDAAAAELAEMSLSLVKDVPGPPDQDRVDSPSNFSSVTRKRSNDMTKATNLAKMAGSSFSERERRLYEEHNVHVQQLEAEGGGNSSHGGSSKSHTRPPSFDKRHSHDPDSDHQLQQEQAGEPKDFDPDGDSGSVGAKCAASKSSHSKGHIDHHTLHLPPIEPQTPSVGKFRKILKKADDLLPAGSEQRWQDSIEEEAKGAGANVTLSSGTGASLLGRHHDAPEDDDRPLKLSPRQAALLSSSSDSRLPIRG